MKVRTLSGSLSAQNQSQEFFLKKYVSCVWVCMHARVPTSALFGNGSSWSPASRQESFNKAKLTPQVRPGQGPCGYTLGAS